MFGRKSNKSGIARRILATVVTSSALVVGMSLAAQAATNGASPGAFGHGTPPGSATASQTSVVGVVGSHTLGFMTCDSFGESLYYYGPGQLAVNSRAGWNNDYQHVGWGMYLYLWNGTQWVSQGNPGGWHFSFNDMGISDPASDTMNSGIQQDNVALNMARGTYLVMIYEMWLDHPTTSIYTPTHNAVTGYVWQTVGTCTI